MRSQFTYRVVLTVKNDDGSVNRTKGIKVRASSEDRAVDALVAKIESETYKHVAEIIFRQVTFA